MASIRLFRHHVPTNYLLLAAIEILALITSVYVGVWLRFMENLREVEASVNAIWPKALVFAVVLVVMMTAMGMYQRSYREGMMGIILRILAAFILGMIGLSIIFYVKPSLLLGRGALGFSFAVAFVYVLVIRYIFYRVIDSNVVTRRILVLGTGKQAKQIALLRRRVDQLGFIILGYVRINESEKLLVPEEKIVDKGERTLVRIAEEMDADEFVIAMDDQRNSDLVYELLDCKLSGLDVISLLSFFERETGKIKLDILKPSWMIYSDGFRYGFLYSLTKRSFDIVASLLILSVAWPFMLLTALAIFIESGFRGPLFFTQVRVGLDGINFKLIKFRSMRIDAEKDGVARWAVKNDNRITRVGKFIRQTRLDELPQILNVLKGDMSFVGPRPERPEFVEMLEKKIPYYRERHRVKPGVTGWAQICYPYGASEKDAFEKLQYDLYYAKNLSLLFDLTILLQTVEVILFGKGAR